MDWTEYEHIPRLRRPAACRKSTRQFTLFPRLPPEVRIMVWEMASEAYGYLHVVEWKNKDVLSNHQYYGPFQDPTGYSRKRKRLTSPLMLVNREAHAIARSLELERPQLLAPRKSYHFVPVAQAADMLYFPGVHGLPTLLPVIIQRPFANTIERLAAQVFGDAPSDDNYIAGQQFEDAIRGLPKLRQLYLVVDNLFSVNFGPGRVPRSVLPQNCPNHVRSQTELRKHIRNQYDDGYGFSKYKWFTRRWQWPIASRPGVVPVTKVPFEDYDAYCHRVVARVAQIADKLQRHIDVKLMVDLDDYSYRNHRVGLHTYRRRYIDY